VRGGVLSYNIYNRIKDMNINSNDQNNVAKIDYLEYSSNLLPLNEYLQIESARVTRGDRFYLWMYDCVDCVIRSASRNRNCKEFMVRIKHHALSTVIECGLPEACGVTRCDICVDFETLEAARALLIGGANAKYSCYIDSRNRPEGGETFYYGDREHQLFERIYFKPDLKVWRYELEIKPQSKALPKKKWAAVDARIKRKFIDLLACMALPASCCYTPAQVASTVVPPDMQTKLLVILKLEYLEAPGRLRFWEDAPDVVRAFCLRQVEMADAAGELWARQWHFLYKLQSF